MLLIVCTHEVMSKATFYREHSSLSLVSLANRINYRNEFFTATDDEMFYGEHDGEKVRPCCHSYIASRSLRISSLVGILRNKVWSDGLHDVTCWVLETSKTWQSHFYHQHHAKCHSNPRRPENGNQYEVSWHQIYIIFQSLIAIF